MTSFHAPYKVLNLIDTRPKESEVKGAVRLDHVHILSTKGRADAQYHSNKLAMSHSTFAVFDKHDESISNFVNRLAEQLGLLIGDGNQYALMFENNRFVTEKNKDFITQGFLLTLSLSPIRYADKFIGILTDAKNISMSNLSFYYALSSDPAFLEALNERFGFMRVLYLVEEGKLESNTPIFHQILRILLTLMSHAELVQWSNIGTKFIQKISSFITGRTKIETNDSLNLALDIILLIIENCRHLNKMIVDEVQIESLIRHLGNPDGRILLGVLSLLTKLYSLSNSEEKQTAVKIFYSKSFVSAISVAIQRESQLPDHRIRAEFLRIQEIILDDLQRLANHSPTDEELDHILKMEEFFASEEKARILQSDDFLKVDRDQFKRVARKTPPGSLALCTILEYVRPNKIQTNPVFREILKENFIRPSLWPLVFAHLSLSLISLLSFCDNSAKQISQKGNFTRPKKTICKNEVLFKLILKCERPFYEFFEVVASVFQRTWNEMVKDSYAPTDDLRNSANNKSIYDDLVKVVNVVQDQAERALSTDPQTLSDFDRKLRQSFSYRQMKKIWELERMDDENIELNNPEIQELRTFLKPSIESLVIKRMKNLLKVGTSFGNLTDFCKAQQALQLPKEPLKKQLWKLDKNERSLTVCDFSGFSNSELDFNSWRRISISSIKQIIHGSEFNIIFLQSFGTKTIKKGGSLSSFKNCFSVEIKNETEKTERFHLSASNDSDFDAWINGLKSLCFPDVAITNSHVKGQVEQLLDLEVRVRLLDLPWNFRFDDIAKEPATAIPEAPKDFSWIPEDFLRSK